MNIFLQNFIVNVNSPQPACTTEFDDLLDGIQLEDLGGVYTRTLLRKMNQKLPLIREKVTV